MKLRSPAGLAGLVLALLLAAPAAAAPVTVDLRIEGANATSVRGQGHDRRAASFRYTGEPVAYTCDGTSANGGPSSVPVPTRGAALMEAAERTPFAIAGAWNAQFMSPTFTHVVGEKVEYDSTTDRYLWETKKGEGSSAGACGDQIQTGDEVVFAYAKFGARVLKLSGPATAQPGSQLSVRVTDLGNGSPVPGATVAGVTTDADGRATVGPFSAGEHPLQATKPDVVRSNHLRLCVTNGTDGACGSVLASAPDTTAPTASIRGIRNGQRFTRRRAPRELSGTASADPSGPVGGQDPPHAPAQGHVLVLLRQQGAVPQAHVRQAVRVQGRRPDRMELPAAGPPAARPVRARHLRDRQRVQPRRGEPAGVPRPMRRAVVIAVAAVAVALPAPASAARVEVMVVGKERVLRAPTEVRLKVRKARVEGRRCRIGAATPLSVLVATKLKLGLRDYGHCGKRPRDAAGLYVARVKGERERGRGGWVYKVGRRTPSLGAADPAGRLRDGRRVTWFWCEQDDSGGCQRTLEARPDRTRAAPGETLSVAVRGYDDQGRGIAVEGATVSLGSATAVSDAAGVAVLTVPAEPGEHRLEAARDGLVRAFPVEVTVG